MKVIANGRVSVVTTFLPPTNHRGSRVKVKRSDHKSGDPTLTVSWDHALNTEENHAEAIRQFVIVLGWGDRDWLVAHSSERGFIGVIIPREVTS
jgi:hypothetical protein